MDVIEKGGKNAWSDGLWKSKALVGPDRLGRCVPHEMAANKRRSPFHGSVRLLRKSTPDPRPEWYGRLPPSSPLIAPSRSFLPRHVCPFTPTAVVLFIMSRITHCLSALATNLQTATQCEVPLIHPRPSNKPLRSIAYNTIPIQCKGRQARCITYLSESHEGAMSGWNGLWRRLPSGRVVEFVPLSSEKDKKKALVNSCELFALT